MPQRYQGVWVRNLLEAPGLRDDTSFVRWLQTGVWHADLRIPREASADNVASAATALRSPLAETDPHRPLALAGQQGFGGVTDVRLQDGKEVCTWHRRTDFQPPPSGPDAGWMVFDTLDRVIETGVHAPYLEVWKRLPGSSGRCIVLARLNDLGDDTHERVLVAGRYLMWVRPRGMAWPKDLPTGQSLAEVIAKHPALAGELLDHEISFGTLDAGHWTIEQSTLPGRKGCRLACSLHRELPLHARMGGDMAGQRWRVLEWNCVESNI